MSLFVLCVLWIVVLGGMKMKSEDTSSDSVVSPYTSKLTLRLCESTNFYLDAPVIEYGRRYFAVYRKAMEALNELETSERDLKVRFFQLSSLAQVDTRRSSSSNKM